MADFDYSVEAKNVLNQFYSVDKIVYVEGDDDIPFWEVIFDKLANFSVEFESAGGKPELMKLVQAIEDGKADYLLALDSDYDAIMGLEFNPAIIRTYGYSMENTLICAETLCKSLKTLLRLSIKESPHEMCKKWMIGVGEAVRYFVACDIVNHVEGLGLSVIPDSSDRFMKSKNSCELCEEKIKEYLDELSLIFREERALSELDRLNSSSLSLLDILRGHFLFSSALRFLKIQARRLGRNISISKDMFYLAIITVFEGLFDQEHRHFAHYKEQIESIPVNA